MARKAIGEVAAVYVGGELFDLGPGTGRTCDGDLLDGEADLRG